MFTAVLLFLVGLAFLILGGNWLVDGAAGIARRFRLPELLIGATVVSIGTTLPEVMVSTTSAVLGHGDMAYGNAIGSVICNTALIAAITIAVAPGLVDRKAIRIPTLFFFASALLFAAVAYTTGYFSRIVGIVMLGIFAAYLIVNVIGMQHTTENPGTPKEPRTPKEPETPGEGEKQASLILQIVWLVAGAALIAAGADLLVDNGTLIAEALGVPESVIALTFMALGTSLPELVTAITSLAKGHGALSLGNVIGANVFNLVLVCGVAVTVSPFGIPADSLLFGLPSSLVLEIPLMFAVMLILTVPALIKGRLYRVQGILLLAIYGGFCVLQFVI